ncbi:MAG TPA: phosphotransferase [Jatrophihabitans sp.]|jgi:kanamycin kinase
MPTRAVGQLNPARWHPEHQRLSVEQALAALALPPAIDHLVVCHGDACAPNTLVSAQGRWTGHVDFGSLGVADRWADLAIATWSADWNYGPGWSDRLLAAYGVEADPVRMRYYRLLWDLGP